MKKVFCYECDYYLRVSPGRINGTSETDGCSIESNVNYYDRPDSPLERGGREMSTFKQSSYSINHDNHCKFFKAKHPYGGI